MDRPNHTELPDCINTRAIADRVGCSVPTARRLLRRAAADEHYKGPAFKGQRRNDHLRIPKALFFDWYDKTHRIA